MNVLRKSLIATHSGLYRNSLQNATRCLTFKSSLSLDNLYPNSSLKITTPSMPSQSVNEKFSGFIPVDKLEINYSRSSGPGGQNVNKVNTKVDLRFHLETADWLHDDIKKKLAEKLRHKLTKEGFLVVRSDLTRSQQLNLADCLEKLRNTIREACYEEPQMSVETLEKIRKRQEKAARERLILKRELSQTKKDRQAPDVRDM